MATTKKTKTKAPVKSKAATPAATKKAKITADVPAPAVDASTLASATNPAAPATTPAPKADPEKISKQDQEKIESLKGVIEEAEKSLFSARAMLARLESKSRPTVQKKTYGASPDGKITEGVFDGQIMIGNDGRQYPVPANYASKSKLVEGDMLKLTITDDGNFIYKQIGPVDRKRLLGMVKEDEAGNFVIEADGRSYKVLLASVTYYKAQPGDEVTIIIPKEGNPVWCSIENVTRKAHSPGSGPAVDPDSLDQEQGQQDPFLNNAGSPSPAADAEPVQESTFAATTPQAEPVNEPVKPAIAAEETQTSKQNMSKIVDEWAPKMDELAKEAGEEKMQNEADKEPLEEEEQVQIKVSSPSQSGPAGADEQGVVAKDFPDTAEEFFAKT